MTVTFVSPILESPAARDGKTTELGKVFKQYSGMASVTYLDSIRESC